MNKALLLENWLINHQFLSNHSESIMSVDIDKFKLVQGGFGGQPFQGIFFKLLGFLRKNPKQNPSILKKFLWEEKDFPAISHGSHVTATRSP